MEKLQFVEQYSDSNQLHSSKAKPHDSNDKLAYFGIVWNYVSKGVLDIRHGARILYAQSRLVQFLSIFTDNYPCMLEKNFRKCNLGSIY